MNQTQQSYQPVQADFLAGFSRVPRHGPGPLASHAQREAHRLREARVAVAAEFLADVLQGRLRAYFLREVLAPSSPEVARLIESNYPGLLRQARPHELAEAGLALAEGLSVSDFPLLMGDVLDRMMLARFAEVPQVWRQYISVGQPLTDFRDVRLIQVDGGGEEWEIITEYEGPEYATISESGHTLSPKLYGKAIKLSWRMLVNDDLDAFDEIPNVLGRGGRHTLAKFATDLLFDANGPDATFFSSGNGNLLTGNPDLAVDSLGTAIGQLAGMTDSDGIPIAMEGVALVHGPALRVTVQNLLNMLSVEMTNAPGISGQAITVGNWLVRGLTAVEDPYIPIVASNANGATSWMLVATRSPRPVARIRFLRGFEQPVLYRKAPNTIRVGGGLDDSVGDFQSMAHEYKGLIAFGGTLLEPKAAVASNGSNT